MVQKLSFLKKEFFFSQETAFTIFFFYPKLRASKYFWTFAWRTFPRFAQQMNKLNK